MLKARRYTIWIVTADEAQKRVCDSSLTSLDTRYFSSWEALISELIHTEYEDHPDSCLMHDFCPEHTLMCLPLLRDSLRTEVEIVLFGAATDLARMQNFYQQWAILDYLALPLRESRLRTRFEFIQSLTA